MTIEVTIRDDFPLGTWRGMGGAVTEAAAHNFAKLSPTKQRALVDAYYGKGGLDYRWCRISIGSNDFCLAPYEYTKHANLRDFSIEHDRGEIIPMLRQIQSKQPKLQIVASPWSPPKCLKIPRIQRRGGFLAPWHYGNYAKYIHRWLNAYADEGFSIKYITPQNEPRALQFWESCLYSYRTQRKLAYKYLAHELAHEDVQILMWDHNKKHLTQVAEALLKGQKYGEAEKVAGLCYHWYNGTHPDEMWQVRQEYPNAVLLSSEMCCGCPYPYDEQDWRGAAGLYLYELLSDINTGATAWIDWNMLLDEHGGPSYCRNFVKSPIILNGAEDDIVLTPIYRALQKFAQAFPAGSKVIRCDINSDDVAVVARKTSTGYEVIAANKSHDQRELEITFGKTKKSLKLEGLDMLKIEL